MNKPRPFSHKPIYIDSRKERLDAIEQRARRELGLDNQVQTPANNLRGAFRRVQQNTRQQSAFSALSLPMIIMIILVLLIVWIFLL